MIPTTELIPALNPALSPPKLFDMPAVQPTIVDEQCDTECDTGATDGKKVAKQDPFRYGHRIQQRVRRKKGEEEFVYIPIQPKDFLDPQHGDHFVQGNCHEDDVDACKSIFRRIHKEQSNTAVYCDMKMFWGIAGLSEPAPDIAVIPNVRDWKQPRQAFYVQEEGTRPRFVLELVSPNYVKQDYENKVKIYERAGVEEYIIIDSGLRENQKQVDYRVSGYRLKGENYVKIDPDPIGRIYSQVNDIWVAARADRRGFEIFDGKSGELILPDLDELEHEKIARIQAQDRAEVAEEIAEQERLARSQAEALAEQERVRAEQERLARSQAEALAEQERLARSEVETKLAEVMAQLQAFGIQLK